MTPGQLTCAVEVSPGVVDAGADLTLRGKVSCSPPCDLRGHTLVVTNQAGAEIGRVEVTAYDGRVNETSGLVVKAPAEAGGHTWLAVSPAVVEKGVTYGQASTPISFTVEPHATTVLAWDIPSAVVAGERFTIRVGIKCSSECQLANSRFEIDDHEGRRVAAGPLSGDRWPGTSGLYAAEVRLEAPAAEGLYTWSARSGEPGVRTPHSEGRVDFGVRVVSRPECLVTVEAVEGTGQTPLEGARVVMHPFKTVTDARGIAEVRVPKGAYRLFVSQTGYITFALQVEVAEDMTARAELQLEPVSERN